MPASGFTRPSSSVPPRSSPPAPSSTAAASRPTRVHGIWMCGMLPLSTSRETATIARCSSSAAAAGDERHAAGGPGQRDRHELGEPARSAAWISRSAPQVRDALGGGLDVAVEQHGRRAEARRDARR